MESLRGIEVEEWEGIGDKERRDGANRKLRRENLRKKRECGGNGKRGGVIHRGMIEKQRGRK